MPSFPVPILSPDIKQSYKNANGFSNVKNEKLRPCNHQVHATYSFPYQNAASERILALLTTGSTEEYWSFGLNGRVLGEIIYSLSEIKYLQKLYLKDRDYLLSEMLDDTWTIWEKVSPWSSQFFSWVRLHFKSKVFYGLLWKLFLSVKMLCCDGSNWGALKKWCIPLYLLQGKSFTTINILKLLENQQSHQFLLAYCLLTLILVKPMLSAGIIRHFEWKTGRSWMKSDLSKSLWKYRFFEGEN